MNLFLFWRCDPLGDQTLHHRARLTATNIQDGTADGVGSATLISHSKRLKIVRTAARAQIIHGDSVMDDCPGFTGNRFNDRLARRRCRKLSHEVRWLKKKAAATEAAAARNHSLSGTNAAGPHRVVHGFRFRGVDERPFTVHLGHMADTRLDF